MARDRRIAAVLEIIERQPTVSIAALAAAVDLGLSRLRHLFRKEVGVGLAGLLLNARLDKTAELLRTTHRRISDIAYDLGFSDSGLFDKRFHRRFGMTPTTYRDSQPKT